MGGYWVVLEFEILAKKDSDSPGPLPGRRYWGEMVFLDRSFETGAFRPVAPIGLRAMLQL